METGLKCPSDENFLGADMTFALPVLSNQEDYTLTGRIRMMVQDEPGIFVFLFLLLLGYSIYSRALRFVPTDIDDVLILSSVANVQNPLSFLSEDIGLGKNEYRPLHAMSVWAVYKVVGIDATYHQMINIILQLLNSCLLLHILRRMNVNGMLLILIPAVFLLSVYSFSPATWISDRPALLVGGCLLLVMLHFVNAHAGQSGFSIPYLVALSVFALLSKESGIIIPLFISGAVLLGDADKKKKYAIITLCVGLVVSYFGFRVWIFGSDATAYRESGVIFGFTRYSDRSDLSLALQYYALAENALKNILAPVLPIFDNKGGLFVGSPAIPWALMCVVTVLLFVGATRGRLSAIQKYALLVIVVNSVVHSAVFRYRTQYVSELAFCVYLGASVMVQERGERQLSARLLSTVLVFSSLILVNQHMDNAWMRRFRLLTKENFGITDDRFGRRVDKGVVDRIRERYSLAE